MKIDELINELKMIKSEYGNMECLVEINIGYGDINIVPIDEISIIERDEYGLSALFIQWKCG